MGQKEDSKVRPQPGLSLPLFRINWTRVTDWIDVNDATLINSFIYI